MWFSEACESVEVGYVRVCLRYSHTLRRNASLLITLLRSDACNLKKQILAHSISLCSTCAYLYINCVCVCVCACLMCLYLLCLIIMCLSEWPCVGDIYMLCFTYSTPLSPSSFVCVCVCYFVLWVLRVWVFPLLETQFELNSLLSWASGGIFFFLNWQHCTATVI